MSRFAEKIISGVVPTDEEWKEHLVVAHRDSPGMTPRAFAGYRTDDGLNSYQVLSQALQYVDKNAHILDLACGDGYLSKHLLPVLGPAAKLTGIDMSEEELAVARSAFPDQRIRFVAADATELPLPDKSVDLVLCHLALMLMHPVEPVVIDRRYPTIRDVHTGDERLASALGVSQVFGPSFGLMEYQEFSLNVVNTPQGIWDLVKDMYMVTVLDPEQRKLLCDELTVFLRAEESGGVVRFELPLRKLTLNKISPGKHAKP